MSLAANPFNVVAGRFADCERLALASVLDHDHVPRLGGLVHRAPGRSHHLTPGGPSHGSFTNKATESAHRCATPSARRACRRGSSSLPVISTNPGSVSKASPATRLPLGDNPMRAAFAAREQLRHESGLGVTYLRPDAFASNTFGWRGSIRARLRTHRQ